jgi:predicted short-subunit dehydrogenase-like oxidoreductase (DUF2520 family)
MTRLSLGVIGAGRVGAVLASRFRTAGYPLAGVSGRSEASQLRISTLLPGVDVLAPVEVAVAADILILAVPDDSLIRVAEELAASGAVRPGQYVLHTSGRHGLDALAALTRLGARPIAFHPAMTFTGTSVDVERTPVFGLTAAPSERPLAEELVTALGGTAMWVAEADRALYHAALAHGANHLVTLVAQSMDLLRTAGAADPAAVLRPLLGAALDNVLAYGDAALTGPVVRGDVTTIRAHVDALAAADVDDATVDAYLELARATAGRAEADGRLAPREASTIRQVLDEADWDAMAEIAAGI